MRFDPDGDMFRPIDLFMDPGAKAILGYSPDELPSNVPAWHERVLPEDLPKLRGAVEDYFAGRRPTYEVEYRVRRRDGAVRWISSRGRLSRDPDGRPIRMTGVIWDATERKEAEERQRLLLAELDHRVKNTLSRVQSIMTQSLRGARSAEEFAQAFEGRIAATARAHNLLTRESWRGADLRDLALQELAPHAGGADVEVAGEPVRLDAASAVSFAMAFHELTTNAVKYGALSRPGGRVAIRWRREGGRLQLSWTESGGPPVAASPRRGFGSMLIERGLAYELRGEARLEFRPEGVRCLVDAPLQEPA
jgi:PAS domain S-box-containing protein